MTREKFEQIVHDHLVPLFSGVTLERDVNCTPRHSAVSLIDPCTIRIKPNPKAEYGVRLKRSQPFASNDSSFITERRVVEAFVSILHEMKKVIGTSIEQDLLAHFTRRVAVKAMCNDSSEEPAVLSVIDQFDAWSTKLYEGQPISATVGFTPCDGHAAITLHSMWKNDFSAVLTNGFDTILISDFKGGIHAYEPLPAPTTITPSMESLPFTPHRLASIADWTQSKANKTRLAVVLNRQGEILVIRDGQLVFARRGGDWHFLTHAPVLTQMKCPQKSDVRKAVYASCLDTSFARTGACIGIMTSGDSWKLSKVAPRVDDHIQSGKSSKAKLIRRIIGTHPFQSLDRRLRQELMAIDGATILDHTGKVLAVGAILHIEGGSTGGGRLAAAIALSKYGMGIKVSQDGGIEGYYRCKNSKTAKSAFIVMSRENDNDPDE